MRQHLHAIALALLTVPALAGAAASEGGAKYFAGITLVDQDGRGVELYRDVIANHTIVLHTFFSHCTASCPVTMNTLKAMQGRLGERMDGDVRLISITVDPLHDTPASLHEYAARLKARPGWYFLTGSSEQVAAALKRIGEYTDDPVEHMDLLVAGNDRTGLWKKISATASTEAIADIVMGVADDHGE